MDLPLGGLADEALAQRTRLDTAVGADDDAREYLERLESMGGDDGTIPSGEELASEIERFLQGESGGDEPPRLS